MVKRTLQNQIIEVQPVIRQTAPNHIYWEHPVYPISSVRVSAATVPFRGDRSSLTAQPLEFQASTDPGSFFNGRTYGTRVFDHVLNDYVYVLGDHPGPRGALVM